MGEVLSDEKILVTGPAGQIGFPLARALAADNEVWGAARFTDPTSRERVDAVGVKTVAVDLAAGDLSALPADFTYVLHLAVHQGGGHDYDHAIAVNAEGTGFLLQHCRSAKAALVMSTFSVYRPHPDASHAYAETDPLGDANVLHAPTYSVSKVAQEAVARYAARALDLPVVIARMNASYGDGGGLPAIHLDTILRRQPVITRWNPCTYSPVHEDDIVAQTGPLLAAAGVPATIVNWSGDEPVSVQAWCQYFAELTGVPARVEVRDFPGTQPSAIGDATKRMALTGPCRVSWREGMRRMVETRAGGVGASAVPGRL